MPKLLVPIDFSETSISALRFGCYLADVTGYDLEVLHVHDGYDDENAEYVIKKGSARIRSQVRERLEQFVSRYADTLTFTGTHDADDSVPLIHCREAVGQAIGELVAASKDEAVALLVMGGVGSGHTSAVTPLFGSVARSVALQSACPVLLIPADSPAPKIENATIAFDYLESLTDIGLKTKFLRDDLSLRTDFVHVNRPDSFYDDANEPEVNRALINRAFPDEVGDFEVLPKGDVVGELLHYLDYNATDLLILGRHPRNFLQRIFMESKIGRLAGATTTPLLIVPLDH